MELQWIEHLRTLPGAEWLGDDAAVLNHHLIGSGEIALTVDALTEGVDFLLSKTEPERIGRKALAVNLSDLAAMGAVPVAVLVSLVLPRDENGFELARRLYDGMRPLLEKYRIQMIGGDTNSWNGGLVLSITALGRITEYGPIRRNGGRPDDAILVTGSLGGSLPRHQFDFEPRIREALYLNEHHEIHAGLDISDGLSLDLYRLATESRLGAVLEAEAVPISPDAAEMSKTSGKSPLEHALSDGEDFELLLAVPEAEAERLLKTQPLREPYGTTLFQIGRFTPNSGLSIVENGAIRPLVPEGFQHD